MSSRPTDRRAASSSSTGPQRRALTGQRSGGKTERGGDPRWADVLEAALRAPQRFEPAETGGAAALDALHGLHPYPARMHVATARAMIAALGKPGVHVLDPFCGSGTTLIEARRAGYHSLGVDISPLAVGISRAKSWAVDKERLKELRRVGKAITRDALAEGKDARRSGFEPAPQREIGRDPVARARALSPWFLPHIRRELEDLAARIDAVGERDADLATALRVALSSILYKVSLRASETDASRVEKKIGRGKPTRLFGDRVEMLYDGLNALGHRAGPLPDVVLGDARKLDLADRSVDVILTSSPYAGTYDYVAQQDLRMWFFGVEATAASAREIGARQKSAAGAADYRADLAQVLREWVRVLKPGAMAALMIGDSMAAKGAIFADELVNEILPDELDAVAWAWQGRAKLGSAEMRAFGDRAKREHLLLARRV